MEEMTSRMRSFQATALFSMFFALIGFSYNVWRMEATEDNNNARAACFEVLLQLAELEQLVFAAHYDRNPDEGNPRKGWVKVGLINDLSTLAGNRAQQAAHQLKMVWTQNWETMTEQEPATQTIVTAIDQTRKAIEEELRSLK